MSTLRIYPRSLVLFWELSIGTCRFHTRDSMHIGLFLLALEQSFLFKSFMTWLCVTEVHSFLWWSYVFWTQFLRNSSKVCVCLVIVTSILRSGLLWQIMLKRYTLPFNSPWTRLSCLVGVITWLYYRRVSQVPSDCASFVAIPRNPF